MKHMCSGFALRTASTCFCQGPIDSSTITHSQHGPTSTVNSTEISVSGEWVRVPALEMGEKTVVITGRWVKVASVQSEDWVETELEDPESCLKELLRQKETRLRADVFTFAQKPPSTTRRYAYPMEPDSIAVARFRSFKDWWESLPQETRKNVRRAQKRGVQVTVQHLTDELVRGIVEINNESRLRQGRRFPHFGKSFEEVKKDYSSFLDRSDFICANHGTELIGILKIVYRGDIASILQLLVKLRQQDKRPANALLAKAMELCERKGISYLTYGKFNYGNKAEDSLTEFKIRHGFQEVLVPRYYVPLTTMGSVWRRLRLYRGLLGILPDGIITVGRRGRLAWNYIRSLTSRCSSTVEQPKRNRPMERSNPPAGSSTNAKTRSPVALTDR